MSYKVISSGSKGNAVLYHGTILVDCGVSYSLLKPYVRDIQLILLTHEHIDHINISTLKKITKERPTLRVGCCDWMTRHLSGIKNVDVYAVGNEYDYGTISIIPVKLYHDVPNCGYRIFKGEYKIIHATDTAHLDGITAPNYDLYAIEHNYDDETIMCVIKNKLENGVYSYERGAINCHLSEQQARNFIFNNRGENSEVLRLHETSLIK